MQKNKETDTASIKKPFYRMRLVFIAIMAILIALVVGGGVWYHHMHRYIPGKVTFQEFALGYLPSNVTITKKYIQDWYIPASSPSRYTRLYIELSDESSVYENKLDESFGFNCSLGKIVNQDCAPKFSPEGQQYQLTTRSIPNQPVEQSIQWLRSGTVIQVNLTPTDQDGYPLETLGKIVDIFKPVHYEGLQVHYIDKSVI
jgi:hypothetical protein